MATVRGSLSSAGGATAWFGLLEAAILPPCAD